MQKESTISTGSHVDLRSSAPIRLTVGRLERGNSTLYALVKLVGLDRASVLKSIYFNT